MSLFFGAARWIAGTRVGRGIGMLLVGFATVVGIYAAGKKKGEDARDIDELIDNQGKRQGARNAVAKEKSETVGSDADDILDRLRRRDGDFGRL